jgi:hypothetical protein
MTLRERRVHHSFIRFKQNIGLQSLTDYYNLENVKVELVQANEHVFNLSFHYLNKCPLLTINLPSDIIHYIKNFLREQVTINAFIYYPPDYPWSSPVWSIGDYKTTLQRFISKCSCIELYNESYAISWTIVPVLEHDILHYLVWLMG